MVEKRTRYVLEVFLVSCLVATVLCNGQLSSPRRGAAHRAPSRLPHGGGEDDGYHGTRPPKHIMKVMQQLSEDKELLLGRGNTVRSYLPQMRFECNKPMYVFSFRPHKTEYLESLEVHFFSSQPSDAVTSGFSTTIELFLMSNTSANCRVVGAYHREAHENGWHVIDVTPQMSGMINTSAASSPGDKITVGVSFTVDGSRDTPRDWTVIQRSVSNHARPFILLFAQDDDDDNQENSLFPWTQDGDAHTQSPKTDAKKGSRHRRSVDNTPIMTNEYPDGLANIAHQATFQHFTEQDSKRRKAKKRSGKRRTGGSRRKSMLMDGESSQSTEEAPSSSAKDVDRNKNAVHIVDPADGVCSRHPMRVDFNTINWDVYVIAPPGMDAFYCAGDCSFPLTKALTASNHAAIQSIMSVAGSLHAKIPAPCCVPDTLSPLSMLSLDEDSNVVLKNYRNMVVETCRCR